MIISFPLSFWRPGSVALLIRHVVTRPHRAAGRGPPSLARAGCESGRRRHVLP